jgi:hypothetical protein
MDKWPDAKRFLFEGIAVHCIGCLTAFTWDFWINLAVATGIDNGQPHEYSFGLFQAILLVFCALQLLRYLNFWRYWR